MATWEVRYGSDANVWLTVTATESDVNIANNTSKVTVKVELVSKTTYTAWNGNSQSLSVKVDGSTIGSRTFTYNLAGNARVTLGTYSKTVTHNSDGSKTSAIAVSASGGGDSGSISQNLGLTTIARATTPTVSASSVSLGSSITINLPRASSSFTHDIRYDFAGLSGQTSGIATPNGATTSTTFTPPASLASRIPNSTSNGIVFTVTTKNGSTVIGSKSITFTINVPNNATYNPTVGTPSVSEQNSTISTGITGIWVQNHSKIRITATASPKYSATVKSARISIGGAWRSANVSGNTITIASNYVPTVSGSHSYTVEITDSRERKATSTGSLTVTAYSKPRLVLSASRKPDNPLKIIVTAKSTGSSLSAKNTMQMEVYSRVSGATTWGTKLTLPTGKVESSTTGEIDWGTIEFGDYAETSSYEVRVRTQDELTGWAEAVIPISTTAVLFNAYKDMGISVGKMYEPVKGGPLQVGSGTSVFDGGIHVAGPLYMGGGIQPVFLGANTDLNTIIKPGFYYANSNAHVATMKNCPVVSAFSLQVELHAGYKQTLTVYLPNNILTLVRNHYAGTWGEWYSYYEGSAVENKRYDSFLNGYSGIFNFRKVSNLVYFDGYFQGTGTARVESDHNLFYPDAKYAPITHLRVFCAPWGTSTNFPEQQGAVLRIESAKVAVEKSTPRSVRFYVFGCYMTDSNVR